jgi:hypothetical protein
MRFHPLSALVALAPAVAADFLISSPAAGVTVPAGVAMIVTIGDTGNAPPISTFQTFTLELIQGGQDEGAGQVRLAKQEREKIVKAKHTDVLWRVSSSDKIIAREGATRSSDRKRSAAFVVADSLLAYSNWLRHSPQQQHIPRQETRSQAQCL